MGFFNVGFFNVGFFNMGFFNVGFFNVGFAKIKNSYDTPLKLQTSGENLFKCNKEKVSKAQISDVLVIRDLL